MSRIFTRGTTTLIVCSHGIALFLEHMDDEQEPKISSEISPHINDKQLGRLNSYGDGSKLYKTKYVVRSQYDDVRETMR